jgi:Uma2 family endonuclease
MSPVKQQLPTETMTVDQFLAWAEQQPGRYELYCGKVYAMAPERAGHAVVKGNVFIELVRAVKAAGVACRAMPDGMTVRITDDISHEPDALVYCGPTVPHDTAEIANPMIVVEVLSPSTKRIDTATKLENYFSLASVQHYLIIDPEPKRRFATLHSRRPDGLILARIIRSGSIVLEPPGLNLNFDAFFD